MFQFIENGSVTSVKGIKAAGIFSGIKRKRKDLALIFSDYPCNSSGTYTLNKVQAAPLLLTKATVAKNDFARAVLVNSGNANACTGEAGYNDALQMQKWCAEKLNIKQEEVLIASTGVIGQRLPMDTIKKGIDEIVPQLCTCGGLNAAEAIMTTDTKIKSYAVNVQLKKGTVTIGGIGKGSGMIMPNMATMLGFITTDAAIAKPLLHELLLKSVQKSFNKISVDGDTSTNDMVVLLANGASGISIEKDTEASTAFLEALQALCIEMAKSIVSDGEGASKLVTVSVKNAKTQEDANLVGKSISNSPLVKTAIYGADANWGRILSAAGNSGAEFEPSKVSIYFNDLPVLLPDYKLALDEEKAAEILSQKEFTINVDLSAGSENCTWWTCDFTEEYIRINADYRT